MSTTGYTSAVPQESVWGFNPCGIFCGITMYHTSTTALLCGILWVFFFSVVFPMVFLVPHEYHRLHFCSTTGLCVVLHYPCGIFCGIMQYHRNTTRYFCKGSAIGGLAFSEIAIVQILALFYRPKSH